MRVLLSLFPAVALFSSVVAGQKAADERIQQEMRSYGEAVIEARLFQEERPLTDFLAALEKQAPAGKKWALRLDAEALGKQLPVLARTPIALPQTPAKTSLLQALRVALNKLGGIADLRIEPGEVVLTTPRRALFVRTYEVADILQNWNNLAPHPGIRRFTRDLVHGDDAMRAPVGVMSRPRLTPAERSVALVEMLMQAIDPPSWQHDGAAPGTIRILNGTRLEVRANWDRHEQVANLLAAMRRLQDVAVVMDARLYEVDAAFYAKHLEPLFRDGRTIAADSQELEALLAKQQLVLKGGDLKVPNNGEAVILSLQNAFTLPLPPLTAEEKMRRTFLEEQSGQRAPEAEKPLRPFVEGVSFAALVEVSHDRRRVRARITQKTSEVAMIPKMLEDEVGKQTVPTVPFPTQRETTSAGYLDAHDGMSFVVRVEHRPRAGQERRYVLWIQPRIYIEEEERQMRAQQPK